jgi:tetratricopeptide (TPR) repeat protein
MGYRDHFQETIMLTRVALPLLAALALSAGAQAAVTMKVTSAAETTRVMDVTLADDYISVRIDKVTTIFDFKNRRRIAIDEAAKFYVDYSLYDTVGFRKIELKNRAGLNQMLAKANAAVAPGLAVDREQELSIADDAATVIDESSAGATREFSSGGRIIARISTKGAKVGAADAARFAQFLRYTQMGHPQILAKLAQGGLIPDRLSFSVIGLKETRTVNIVVDKVNTIAPPAYDLHGYTRRQAVAPAAWIDVLLDRMAALTPQQLQALRAAHACDTAADYREDQLLDTVLGRMECPLATGEAMLPFTPEQQEQLRAAGELRLMFASTQPGAQKETLSSVEVLAGLRKQAPRKAYMLKLFEANNRLRLGQRKESLQLFGEVLEANPLLAGAYKDLGDWLLTQFDPARAWRCWDIGRRLAPEMPNFTPVNQFEADLLKRHPEYF